MPRKVNHVFPTAFTSSPVVHSGPPQLCCQKGRSLIAYSCHGVDATVNIHWFTFFLYKGKIKLDHIPSWQQLFILRGLTRTPPPSPEPSTPVPVYFGLTCWGGPAYCSCQAVTSTPAILVPIKLKPPAIHPSKAERLLPLKGRGTERMPQKQRASSGYSSKPSPLAGNGWSP